MEGTGLGLSIARELARAHGGEILLRQADATWTELMVSLPQSA
jgi:two-component system sensor histidine kinase FlrB